MSFVDTLIICMYSRDDHVVWSITTLDCFCPCIFVTNTEMCCAVGSTIVLRYVCALVLYQCVAQGKSYLLPV